MRLLLPIGFLFAACSSIPSSPPSLELPQATASVPAELANWWTRFDDPALNKLIAEALVANNDLRLAAARVAEARAAADVARSGFLPSVALSANAVRARSSERAAMPLPPGVPLLTTSYAVGLDIAYEVDLWGRVRNASAAAEQDLLASHFAREAAQASIVATVVRNYVTLIALDAEIELLKRTIATREENVSLEQRRFDLGAIGELELAQALAQRDAVRASLPVAEQARARNESALAALAGRTPQAVYFPQVPRGKDLAALTQIASVPAGLHSELLIRRPDVKQTEARLEASDLRIAEARASYFPQITLTGLLGFESGELSELITTPARVWRAAGALAQPLIGLGRIHAQIRGAEARREQSLIAYEATVQTAFRETFDALRAQRTTSERIDAERARRAALARVRALADLRYRNGYSSYLEFLDAERNLLDAERALLAAERDRLLAIADLYLALGGGWESQSPARASH